MATKSKLDKAVEEQAESLPAAQRELVRAQYAVYKRNRERISGLSDRLAAVNAMPAATLEEVRMKQAERSSLSYEYAQLVTANSRISAELFGFLEER